MPMFALIFWAMNIYFFQGICRGPIRLVSAGPTNSHVIRYATMCGSLIFILHHPSSQSNYVCIYIYKCFCIEIQISCLLTYYAWQCMTKFKPGCTNWMRLYTRDADYHKPNINLLTLNSMWLTSKTVYYAPQVAYYVWHSVCQMPCWLGFHRLAWREKWWRGNGKCASNWSKKCLNVKTCCAI